MLSSPMNRDPLDRRDWTFIAICIAVAAVSAMVIARWFGAAFPEASIDFKYDRNSSRAVAESLLKSQRLEFASWKHAATFDGDDSARIFLERSLGLEKASAVMKRDVRLWFWHHRWFRPLQEEELNVDVAPTGEIVSMTRTLPESRPMPAVDPAAARRIAESFLTSIGVQPGTLDLVSQSERRLPARVQRIFTFESKSVRPAGAQYRHTITVDGNAVSSYAQRLRVPEQWLRSYRELRSKNAAAGNVDLVFLIATMIAALSVFIVRLRRGDLPMRFLFGVGGVTVALSVLNSVNSFPSAFAGYNTTTSYAAFVAQLVVGTILQSVGTAMLLVVICGSGEVLFRERFPQHLAIPRLWTPRALASKRVFRSLVLGYTLVAFFIGYQTVFYVVADKFGAWAPAEIPYDDILNTAIPWVAVLFAGFFPAMSEEFMSRAFSIPLFERVFRSRLFAIVLAGFIWGFGHATYPNQPFYIRGVEVGSAGVVLGFLMQHFGLLPLLIWHYTVDAVYTALMLFRSGNLYYVVSAALASLVFAIPLIASIALYIRNHGFVPDDELSNATMPTSEPAVPAAAEFAAPLPPPVATSRRFVLACAAAIAIAAAFASLRPVSPEDVVDYAISGGRATEIARQHLRALGQQVPLKSAVLPVSAFRSWDAESGREDGGSPGGFDDVAAAYMVRHGMTVSRLAAVMRGEVEAATYMVRFFTPLQKTEYFVEIDPRTSRVIGYHKYADERAAGPRLEREAALAIAQKAFVAYGVAAGGFDVKEALAFQQPNRRDWLFHFEQRQPLVGQAVRRVTVRVMGSEVTQFAATVKVPDAVYRDAHQQTVVNVLLLLLKAAGAIGGLALVVAGFVMATRQGSLAWRRAARITAVLALLPIIGAAARYHARLFGYSTSVSWETFQLDQATTLVRTVGLQIVVLFVAVAGILTVYPYATTLLSKAGRARFGRNAALAVLLAVSLLVIGRELARLAAHQFPAIASVSEISVPDEVAMPMPWAVDLASALYGAVLFSGAAALLGETMRHWKNRYASAIGVIALVFCATIDTSATLQELPLMLATSLGLALLTWVVARFVLDGNPLAWPLAAFTVSLLQSGLSMMVNHRADMRLSAAIVFVVAAAVMAWVGFRAEKTTPSTGPA